MPSKIGLEIEGVGGSFLKVKDDSRTEKAVLLEAGHYHNKDWVEYSTRLSKEEWIIMRNFIDKIFEEDNSEFFSGITVLE